MCYSIQELFYYPTLRILVHNNRDKVVNSVLPTNRWANGTNESEVGAVFEVFHRTQAKRLAGVVSIS